MAASSSSSSSFSSLLVTRHLWEHDKFNIDVVGAYTRLEHEDVYTWNAFLEHKNYENLLKCKLVYWKWHDSQKEQEHENNKDKSNNNEILDYDKNERDDDDEYTIDILNLLFIGENCGSDSNICMYVITVTKEDEQEVKTFLENMAFLN